MVVDNEKEDVRKVALEFMIKLEMLRKVNGWTAAIVRGVWRGWGSLLMVTSKCSWRLMCVRVLISKWSLTDSEDHSLLSTNGRHVPAHLLKAVLSLAIQYIPCTFASDDWPRRHAGFMSIATIKVWSFVFGREEC